ncbi:MAG: pilus assembly protein N-terminal domain-containing protein [Alphaproteobacteria bacterium]
MALHYGKARLSAAIWGSCLGLIAALLPGAGTASENLRVTIDKNHVLRTDRPVETIIVGNPHIADVSAQSNQLMFILGRTSGETNILGFDKDGNVVFDKDVTVVPHTTRTVTLHRGTLTETFACAPRCEVEMHPGDDPAKFGLINDQSTAHTGAASGSASSAAKAGE